MATRAQLEGYLKNPNVRKMLELISYTEGTQKHGAATAFGGGKLGNLADHPRYSKPFKQTDGVTKHTSAAGKYQYLASTWDGVAKQYGFKDFGPHNQDLGAVALLIQRNALEPLLKGDFTTAIQRSGKEWASLPSSTYKQGKKSWEKVNDFLGGKIKIPTSSAQPEPTTAPTLYNAANLMVAPNVTPMRVAPPPPSADLISSIFKAPDMVGYSKAGEQTPVLSVGGKLAVPENEKEFNMFSQIAGMGLSPEQESAKAKAASLIAKAQQGILETPLIQSNPLLPGLTELFKMV